MAYYTNPYFNQKYVPETYTYDELNEKIALSGWDILKNPTDEMIPFLCQLMKNADNPDVDPAIIIQNEEPFDSNQYLSTFYRQLSTMDEGRVNFYEVWEHVSEVLVPRALTQLELAQSGGCQIIDGYICNSDGVKIKEKTNVCDENSDYRKPITYDEINNVVVSFMDTKKNNHADEFINYIRTNYIDNGWKIELFFLEKFFLFYLKASKTGNSDFYIKYYNDRRDYISERLNIPLIVDTRFNSIISISDGETLRNTNFLEALASPIPKTFS